MKLLIILVSIISSIIFYSNYTKLIDEIEQPFAEINFKHPEIKWFTARLTMYNAGDPYQTDSSPCISASGDNICQLLNEGINVCASNAYPLGTRLRVKQLGDCIILDRTAWKYKTRIDWALPVNKKLEAKQWGIQTIEYAIIK